MKHLPNWFQGPLAHCSPLQKTKARPLQIGEWLDECCIAGQRLDQVEMPQAVLGGAGCRSNNNNKETSMSKETDQHIMDLCEEKARAGDGAFAIALALLELAEAQNATATALDRLGLNYSNPGGPPGAVEKVAMELGRAADSLVAH
jgi:hypothetical protein